MSAPTFEMIVACAVAKDRAQPSDGAFAYVPLLAHRTFVEGQNSRDALDRLRAVVRKNLAVIQHAWQVLGLDDAKLPEVQP